MAFANIFILVAIYCVALPKGEGDFRIHRTALGSIARPYSRTNVSQTLQSYRNSGRRSHRLWGVLGS
jgi:hypothetical protein